MFPFYCCMILEIELRQQVVGMTSNDLRVLGTLNDLTVLFDHEERTLPLQICRYTEVVSL